MLISSTKQLNAVETGRHRMNPATTTAAASADDNDNDNDDKMSKQLDDVLSSLEAAFYFMKSEVKNMNLDAIIGTRMVQGLSASAIAQ